MYLGRHALDGLGQHWRNRNAKMRLSFFLMDLDESVFDILPAHADNVRAALARTIGVLSPLGRRLFQCLKPFDMIGTCKHI